MGAVTKKPPDFNSTRWQIYNWNIRGSERRGRGTKEEELDGGVCARAVITSGSSPNRWKWMLDVRSLPPAHVLGPGLYRAVSLARLMTF